jgi:hypothetical protein
MVMTIRSSITLVVLSALAAASLFAAGVTGKWKSVYEGRDGQKRETIYNLKADGEKLTGTISSQMLGDREISDGKITGDEISFVLKVEFQGEARKLLYNGKVAGDELKLTMKSENGEFSRDFVAKRAD